MEKLNFRDSLRTYLQTNSQKKKEEILQLYPFIKEALDILGEKRCKQLGCEKSKLKNAIANLDDYNQQQEYINNDISDSFTIGKHYSIQNIKRKIQTIYNNHHYDRKATGTSLKRVFNIKYNSTKKAYYIINRI